MVRCGGISWFGGYLWLVWVMRCGVAVVLVFGCGFGLGMLALYGLLVLVVLVTFVVLVLDFGIWWHVCLVCGLLWFRSCLAFMFCAGMVMFLEVWCLVGLDVWI